MGLGLDDLADAPGAHSVLRRQGELVPSAAFQVLQAVGALARADGKAPPLLAVVLRVLQYVAFGATEAVGALPAFRPMLKGALHSRKCTRHLQMPAPRSTGAQTWTAEAELWRRGTCRRGSVHRQEGLWSCSLSDTWAGPASVGEAPPPWPPTTPVTSEHSQWAARCGPVKSDNFLPVQMKTQRATEVSDRCRARE